MHLNINTNPISLAQLSNIWREDITVTIDALAKDKILISNEVVRDALVNNIKIYGVNTGSGQLSKTQIDQKELSILQRNLVVSHATGVGKDLSIPVVRLAMILKLNTLAQGYSGVTEELVNIFCEFINNAIYPCVPSKGSVGASGDLAPLAHIAQALLGEGNVFYQGKKISAKIALKKIGKTPYEFKPKEGLALLNGTQISTAISLGALFRTESLLSGALISGVMAIDAIKGSVVPFREDINRIRPHKGQIAVAGIVRSLIEGSEIKDSHIDCDRIQDPYSIRCQPQVMGSCLGAMNHVSKVLSIESNSVTDNPLVFSDSNEVVSGGNFHAEPVAFVSDYLALAISEIGALSERRIALLNDENHSGLPPFLVKDGGINSGFMNSQVTAAALASENKSLAHPASVDSMPTSANQEDHVSMATFAASRLHNMIDNSMHIVAIELLATAQGISFHRPKKSSIIIEDIIKQLRVISPQYIHDRSLSEEIENVFKMIEDGNFNNYCRSILPSYLI